MSGLLLPGTAGPAQVLSGYTASGAAGLGFAGSTLFPAGALVDSAAAYFSALSQWALTLPNAPLNGSSLVLVTGGAANPTGVSGAGATWSQAYASTSGTLAFWLGTGATSASSAVTATFAASETGNAFLLECAGDLTVDSTTTTSPAANPASVGVTTPAGGVAVFAAQTGVAGNAGVNYMTACLTGVNVGASGLSLGSAVGVATDTLAGTTTLEFAIVGLSSDTLATLAAVSFIAGA